MTYHKESLKEVWKDIEGYEGLYQVSSYGRVKSLAKKLTRRDGIDVNYKERVLKPYNCDGGYQVVALYKNNDRTQVLVHRLVAQSFLDNPENKPEVNHIDFNTANNNLFNLEWTTRQENIRHSQRAGRFKNKTQLAYG